jgi:hypothetical protein
MPKPAMAGKVIRTMPVRDLQKLPVGGWACMMQTMVKHVELA